MSLSTLLSRRLVCKQGRRNITRRLTRLLLIVNRTTTHTTRHVNKARRSKVTSLNNSLSNLLSQRNSLQLSRQLTRQFTRLLRGFTILNAFSQLRQNTRGLSLALFRGTLLNRLRHRIRAHLPTRSQRSNIKTFRTSSLNSMFRHRQLRMCLIHGVHINRSHNKIQVRRGRLMTLFLRYRTNLHTHVIRFNNLSSSSQAQASGRCLLCVSSLERFCTPPLF